MLHWLWFHLGLSSGNSPWYLFPSGWGANLGEFAIAGGLLGVVRKHNCEVRRCWRLGRHATAAGHLVCRRHHPGEPLTAEAVAAAHADAENATKEPE